MYTDEDLYAAVKAGIFEEGAVSKFRKYISESSNTISADEENFRLISGFNDIFVSIASLLLLFSAGWLGFQFAEPVGYFIAAAIAWFLSVYFVIKKKLALPAIVFLVTFVVSTVGCIFFMLQSYGFEKPASMVLASGFGALAAWLHWYKFKVPITVAAGVASLVACLISIITTQVPSLKDYVLVFVMASGVMAFFIAMYWDSQDTERKTRKSDVAFWLHLLSAPLIVHPIFSGMGILMAEGSIEKICVVIALYIFLGLVSVAIDRRALMVSSLIYILYALTALFKTYGMVSFSFSIAGIFIGTLLLLLSAFWHKSREILWRFLPEYIKPYLPTIK